MNVYAVIPLVAAVIYAFLLIMLMTHRPWPRRHVYFAVFLMCGIFWSLSNMLFRSNFLMDYKLLLARSFLWGFVITLIPFSHFLETFLYGKSRIPWLALSYFSLAGTTASTVLGYLPDRIVYGDVPYSHYNVVLLLAFIAVPFGTLGVRGVYRLLQRLKTAENPAIHNQAVYLIVCIAIIGIASLSNVIPVGRQLPIAHSGSLMVAMIFTYAILKGQLIDFKLVARKGMVYAGVTAVLAAVYLVFLYLFYRLLNLDLSFQTVAVATGIAVGMAALSYPISNVLNLRVGQLLYPKTHDYRRMLLSFSRKASNIIKIDELGSELTKLAMAATGAKSAYLMVPDPSGSDYTARFVVPETSEKVLSALRLGQDNPILDWLKREGKPLFRESLDILPEFSNLWADEVKAIDAAKIELFTPLISRGNLVGVLALAKKEPASPYNMSDVDLIGVLTHSIAAAIENAQLHARIEMMAATDVLTGLSNRRNFDDRLAEEISRHARYGGNFSLIMLDLDHFKNYNDTYGHGAGDQLLQEVARATKESARSVDPVFRYGGDEFAILLPETAAGEARIVGERVRTRLALEMKTKGTGVTPSLGMASWPADGLKPTELVRAADEALYRTKRAGGNGLSVFSEVAPTLEGYPVVQSGDEKTALSAAYALVAAVDAKDHYTGNHSRLVSTYAVALARAAGLPNERIAILQAAALLHDVGKIGIPDNVLNKAEKLTPEEWGIIKGHSKAGTTIIGHVPGLAPCLPIILHHHEQYNGTGYPDGLKGDAIPLEARILAIADSFFSMISAHPYRGAFSRPEAIEELKRCSGSQFDPELVKLFIPIVLGMSQAK